MLSPKRSWDPLYGRIQFSDYEYGLLRLAEVQRLRYVRMCNINSLLVTGASEISRFEHTVGVLHLTKCWCKANSIPNSISKDLIAAAVLHDMQTGPFGHSMQYVLEDNESDSNFIHEDLAHGWKSTYHQQIMAGAAFAGKSFSADQYLGPSWENVAKIIRGEGPYGPLIAGTMDLDNIDNVVRLAFHVGAASSEDSSVAIQLAEQIGVHDRKLTISESVIPVVERWQEIRSRLYSLLLLDWAEFSAKAMLTRAIELATRFQIVGADSWVRTDAEFLDYLEKSAIGEAQEIRSIVMRLKRADLYEPVVLGASKSVNSYATLNSIEKKSIIENAIAKNFGAKGVKLISHYILDKAKTSRKVEFISAEDGRKIEIGHNSQQLLCGLFVSKPLSESERMNVASIYKEVLNEQGVEDLEPIEDPMGETEYRQQFLI